MVTFPGDSPARGASTVTDLRDEERQVMQAEMGAALPAVPDAATTIDKAPSLEVSSIARSRSTQP